MGRTSRHPAKVQLCAVRLVESCRPRPDEPRLHTPPANTTRRGAIHELVGVAGPLPARSPLSPRQLPERTAVLAQWPRWRSERDFWRFADVHLRGYFPNLLSHGQLNRRIRALEPVARALQRDLTRTLTDSSEVYHVLDTTLIPAIVRVRASRKGLFAGQATFGRCVSKTEWVYGFKVALSVTPEGVIAAFGLAEASSDERPIGEFLLTSDDHDAFLADKGFSSVAWEKHWLEEYGALVAATLQKSARRAWPESACRWAASKRQFIEGVIWQLKDYFGLERHRARREPLLELGL